MTYQFDADLAAEFGVDEAVFVAYIHFWTTKNKANERHYHDGRTWTYNSQKALAELFPFWTRRAVQRVVKSCIDHDLIVTGNYNAEGRDRTIWYALGDTALNRLFPLHETVQCIAPNGATQCTKPCNVYNEQLKELQLAAADKPNNENKQPSPRSIMDEYNTICTGLRPCIRLTDKRSKAVRDLLKKGFTPEQLTDAFHRAQRSAFCTGQGQRGWTADFDWLLTENNLVKVLEGKYNDDPAPAVKPGGGFDRW